MAQPRTQKNLSNNQEIKSTFDMLNVLVQRTLDVNSNDIVIIGDGPIALIAAIKFKQKGLNVTVVGPRLDEYIRSGDIDPLVFKKISDFLSPYEIFPSDDNHIKDIERRAYLIAEELGINLVKKKFQGFSGNRTLVLADENEKPSFIHADVVFDCTGTGREVLNKFNNLNAKDPYFKSQSLFDFKHKDYAHVRMLIPQNFLIPDNADIDFSCINPIQYVLTVEALRQLGWKSYQLPILFLKPLSETQDGSRKTNAYFEIPEGASDDQIKQILTILMNLINQKIDDLQPITLHKESKKPQKKMINTFSVNPEQVFPNYYVGDENIPTIMHLGDATANFPFFMGVGLLKGIKRLRETFRCFNIQNNTLKGIHLAGINQMNSDLRTSYAKSVSDDIESVFKPLNISWDTQEKVLKLYRDAFDQCTDPDHKKIIESGLTRLENEMNKTINTNPDIEEDPMVDNCVLFKG